MSERGIGYGTPGSGLGGLIVMGVLVGFAILVFLAPARLLEGDAETTGEAVAGTIGLAIWAGVLAAAATML